MRIWHWDSRGCRGSWEAVLEFCLFLLKPVRSGYCDLCHYFYRLQGEIAKAQRALWVVLHGEPGKSHRNRAYPCYLLSATQRHSFTPLSSCCSLFWTERETAEDSSRDIGPSFLVLGEWGKNTGPLFLALVPESERQIKVFTLLSFRVRWKLGAEPVPLLPGEHSTLCSEDVSLVIPAESAGGKGNTATCPTGWWSWLQCQVRTSGVVLHRNQSACGQVGMQGT